MKSVLKSSQEKTKKTAENKEATQSVLFSSPTHTFFLDFGWKSVAHFSNTKEQGVHKVIVRGTRIFCKGIHL